jgi:MFS family permease
MPTSNRRTRAAATIVFSLIIGIVLGLAGFLVGIYLRGHLGPPQTDPDEMASFWWGMLVGGVFALSGFGCCLFIFWPHKNQRIISLPIGKFDSALSPRL